MTIGYSGYGICGVWKMAGKCEELSTLRWKYFERYLKESDDLRN